MDFLEASKGLISDLLSVKRGKKIVWFASPFFLRVLVYDSLTKMFYVWGYFSVERCSGEVIPEPSLYYKNIGYDIDGIGLAQFDETDDIEEIYHNLSMISCCGNHQCCENCLAATSYLD